MQKQKIKKFIFNPIYDNLKKQIRNKLKKVKNKKIETKEYRYSGEVKNNLPNGWGTMVCITPKGIDDQSIYGEFKNGKLNGEGYIKYKHDLEYAGYFNNNEQYKGGAIWGKRKSKKDRYFFGYEIDFNKNKKIGSAIKFESDPVKNTNVPFITYEGSVNDSIDANGHGTAYHAVGWICEGHWLHNFAHGECKVQYKNEYYEGLWKFGKLEKLTLEGVWKNNDFTIIKDKKNIEKNYIPWLFKKPNVLWILNVEHNTDYSGYAEVRRVIRDVYGGN